MTAVSHHIPTVPHLGDWAASAACLGYDTRIFFPVRGASLEQAYTFCERCTVRRECLEHALSLNPGNDHGVMGGTSRRERLRIRNYRRRSGDNTITWAAFDRRREMVEREG